MRATAWTTPADLRGQVQRHWDNGRLLAASLNGESLFPLELRLRGPDTRALSERFEEVRQWIRELESESRYRIEWREVNHRLLGRNRVPARIVVPGEREALELIGKIGRCGALPLSGRRSRWRNCRNWARGSRADR